MLLLSRHHLWILIVKLLMLIEGILRDLWLDLQLLVYHMLAPRVLLLLQLLHRLSMDLLFGIYHHRLSLMSLVWKIRSRSL